MPTKKSRTRFLTMAFVAATLVVGFTQLPLRTQGRIVEFGSLGDWPLEWAVRRQFERKQPELRSIIQFMNEAPEVIGLTVSPVGLRAKLAEDKGVEHDLNKPNILQALISLEAYFVRAHEDRISVLLGTEYRGKTSFNVSYIHTVEPIASPSCKFIKARDRAKIGGCGIDLGHGWHVRYQWEPTDSDELEQALEEIS